MCGNNKYLEYTELPATYARKHTSAEPTMTTGMIAKPSNPSVRLTALLTPRFEIGQDDKTENTQRIADLFHKGHQQTSLRRQVDVKPDCTQLMNNSSTRLELLKC
jgi:hypothetical protein